MLRITTALVLGLSLWTSGFAVTKTCQIRGDMTAPATISWDPDTKAAHAVFALLGPADGTVTLIRSRNGPNDLVNIVVKPVRFDYADELEFMVFQTPRGSRVVGVNYRYVDGQRYLSGFHGNFEATCE
jgi:hypothetical protein